MMWRRCGGRRRTGAFACRRLSAEAKGFSYVGATCPVGHITPKQMLRVAELAGFAATASAADRLAKFHHPERCRTRSCPLKRRWIKRGCPPSNRISRAASSPAREILPANSRRRTRRPRARRPHQATGEKIELDQPVNIHVTGCPNSCAQHYHGRHRLSRHETKITGESLDAYPHLRRRRLRAESGHRPQVFSGVTAQEFSGVIEKDVAHISQASRGQGGNVPAVQHGMTSEVAELFAE